MQQSQRMEAVGRLVGGIAHDFNNLLTAMMIYSGLLSTALGKQNRLHRYVEEIEGAGARGAELVGQLLSLTRQQVLEPKIISLNSIIDALRDMLQRLIGEDVILETHLSAELNMTRVDPTQIQQVILNLALNARDAMPKGGTLSLITENVTLGEDPVEGSPESAVGEFVRLRVHDTGQGMSKDVVALIFEPFFTTKEIGKGTGLGLASAYGIVRQHGGHIRVESSPGKGARFDIYFPVAGFDAATKDSEFTAAPESHEQPTILLVEDEACVRRPLLELLTTKGYKVLEAAEAEQAKKISAEMKQDIHLMITDLVMPGANGRELAEDLLKLRPEMKVLFMSGYTDDPRTRKLIADGVEFFRKPFSREGLLQKVSYMLRSEDDLMAS
jgi:two-component system, cell cycle sensor histidine kinase and response regulator CckA